MGTRPGGDKGSRAPPAAGSLGYYDAHAGDTQE